MRTEDGHIISKCLSGDSAAFGLLVDKYKGGIYALAYSKLHNFHDAEDVTQEVFIKAYERLRSLRRWDNFLAWLYAITSNLCKMWIRTRSRRPDREYTEDQSPRIQVDLSMRSYREELAYESVHKALDSLPEGYRQVLTLYYLGGMSGDEIARFLGTSPSNVRQRLSRARSRLKEEMVAMMSTTFESRRLPATFTFRIVEAVKRTKIHPMPRVAGLPWGLSLAAGIMVAVMTIGSQMTIYEKPTPLMFPSETETLKVREIAVVILGAPGTSVMVGKQGDIDGAGMDQRSPENTSSLLAPAKGGGTWTQKADMPTKRTGSGCAVVDGKIYILGGWINTAPYTATTTVEEYNPATDTWTKITDMPTERLASFCAVNGIIYAIGGYIPNAGFSSAVEAYDLAADKWTKKASMPTARTDGSCAVVDGKIYVIGGYNAALRMLSTVEVYDPSTDKWSRKADMPTGKSSSICVIDGKIYLFGGNPTWEWGGLIPTVEVYDPATDTWTQVSDMPWIRGGKTASLVNGKVYIIGGVNTDMVDLFNAGKMGEDELVEQFSIVDVYDPATDTWTTAASIPFPRSGHDAGVVDGKIYIIGGMQKDLLLSTVYEFDPGLSGNIAITSPAGKLLRTWGEVKSQ